MTTNEMIQDAMYGINQDANRLGIRAERLTTRVQHDNGFFAYIRPVGLKFEVKMISAGLNTEFKYSYSLLGAVRIAVKAGYWIHKASYEAR